jgi:hypothetical protein
LYWTNIGVGYPIVQQPSDWDSTSGNNQILNKPTIPTQTSDLTNDGEDGVNPFITAADVPTGDLQGVLESGSYAIFLNESNENVEYNFPFQDIGGNYITTFSHSDNVNGLQGVFSMDTSGVYSSSSKVDDNKAYMIQLSCPPAQSVAETYNNFLNLSCVDYITSDEGFYSVLAPTPDFNEDVLIKFPIKPTGDYTLATTDDIPTNVGFEQNFLLMGA